LLREGGRNLTNLAEDTASSEKSKPSNRMGYDGRRGEHPTTCGEKKKVNIGKEKGKKEKSFSGRRR